MTWTPPKGKHVRYDSPPPWREDKTQCEGGPECDGSIDKLLPGARALAIEVLRRPGITRVGGYCCRRNTGNDKETSSHGTSRAFDAYGTPEAMSALADWAVGNSSKYGIQYVIHNHSFWGAGKSGAYTGRDNHESHVHIELNKDGARRSQDDSRIARPSSGSSGAIVLLIIAALVLRG